MRLIARIKDFWNSFEFGVKDEYLNSCIQVCYGSCVNWFGVPSDADKAIELAYGPRSGCSWDPVHGVYTIMIGPGSREGDARFATIAHEVYHRVTWKRWVHDVVYLDEALAFITTRQLLNENGFSKLALERDSVVDDGERIMTLEEMQAVRRRRRGGVLLTRYPKAFYSSANKLGLELLRALEWPRICTLVQSESLTDWLDTLHGENLRMAILILQLDGRAPE